MRLLGLLLCLIAGAANAQSIGFSSPGRVNAPLLFTVLTSTLNINAVSNHTYAYYKISTTSGACVNITNSTNITIKRSQIGPCGTDASTATSNGILVGNGNNGINIYDSYIHIENQDNGCNDSHDGILFNTSAGTVNIKGNIVAYAEKGIYGQDVSNATVDGNFIVNLRGSSSCSDPNSLEGHGVQFWTGSLGSISNIFETNNYLLMDGGSGKYLYTPHMSDGLSCGHVTTCNQNGNYVVYDPTNGTVNANDCQIIVESGTTVQQENNIASQGFHGSLCMSNTNGGTMTGNKSVLKAPSNSSAAGLQLEADTTAQCANLTATGNTAYAIQSGGGLQSLFVSSKCTTNITSSPNTLDAAALSALDPLSSTNPPPLIPPGPFECVVHSTYATQTSKDPC